MTLGERLKTLRRELGLSQEAFGAQGFVSAPGWIKIENSQRQASEKLIERLSKWLVDDKYMRSGAVETLKEELLDPQIFGQPLDLRARPGQIARQEIAEQRCAAGGRGARRVQGQAEARPSARLGLQEALTQGVWPT